MKPMIIFLSLFYSSLILASVPVPAPPGIAATSYILEDFNSGKILVARKADEKIEPASITKLMTAYVVFMEIKAGNIQLSDKVQVSKKAWKTKGSKMFIEVDKFVSVENLLKGMIIQSGNDASVALAEHIAGNEAAFSQLMNRHAKKIGMNSSHFSNSTGLPSDNHYTTARDIAKVSKLLIKDFPEYYAWYSTRKFTFNKITQFNRNKLLWKDDSVDGLKTGYTSSAGYCLVTSAKRDGMRLISVVMGTKSKKARTKESQTLINYGFRYFQTHKLYDANQTLHQIRVWKGKQQQLNLGIQQTLFLTIPKKQYKNLKAWMEIDKNIIAPVAINTKVGSVVIELSNEKIAEIPLLSLQEISKGDLWDQLLDEIKMKLQ
ncbi:MAG: D-alanyl-D-alanine carboxypeptidase [Methylococcales bacterium]|jgi:serine-type D-Ala-D-Ala carboxypeptidase (penicillin-binding protein 5/6)|nr:D-alanyl-D-alanine carboxypeptidase [Methylococcales bacterium]MBT7411220.1 D-alanyl-D-alanine carboxypeptidase [Methylococcales bacterium]